MAPVKKRKWKKYLSVIGATILLLPNGLYMSWGNLSVYSLSYLVFVGDESADEPSAWVLCMFVIFWTLFAIFSSYLIKKLGKIVCLLMGVAINDLAVFLGYYSIQKSLFTLTLTEGVMTGIGTGLLDSTVLQLVIEWADDDAGRLTATVQAALSLGGLFSNKIITGYINPGNLNPGIRLGRNAFFSETAILDKVPGAYLVLGGYSLGVHLLGLLMIRPRNARCENEELKGTKQNRSQSETTQPEEYCIDDEKTPILEKHDYKPRDYTVKDMLKTGPFYALWITLFFGGLSLLLVENYYKAFGQLYIHDDHFLTDVGVVLSATTVIVSFLYGFLMDKVGVKFAFLFNMVLVSLCQIWYWFTPLPSKWLYAIVTVLMASFTGSMLSTYAAAAALLFGSKYFSSNFGVVMSSLLVFNIIAPFVMKPLLTDLGWWMTFILVGGLNIIRLIIAMIWIPQI